MHAVGCDGKNLHEPIAVSYMLWALTKMLRDPVADASCLREQVQECCNLQHQVLRAVCEHNRLLQQGAVLWRQGRHLQIC